jgi:hypothetical protein
VTKASRQHWKVRGGSVLFFQEINVLNTDAQTVNILIFVKIS